MPQRLLVHITSGSPIYRGPTQPHGPSIYWCDVSHLAEDPGGLLVPIRCKVSVVVLLVGGHQFIGTRWLVERVLFAGALKGAVYFSETEIEWARECCYLL